MAGLFTKINPESARLGTLLARRARRLPFRIGETGWEFSAGGRKSAMHGVVAYGALGSSDFSLWLDDPDWRLASASVLGTAPEDVAALPPALVQASLEAFFAGIVSLAEKALGMPVSVSRIDTGEFPPLSSSFRFALKRADGLLLSGAWTVAEGDWRGALESALLSLPQASSPLADDLRLEGVVSAGIWRMPAGSLRELEKGDVALSPSAASWNVTVGRRLRFAAAFEKGRLVADGRKMTSAAASDADAPDANDLSAIDAAEVVLRAEVGRLDVTLAELRRLCVGEVVEFDTPLDAPAALVAGGRTVARGELVDVGGRVGVRITALAQGKEEHA